MAYMELNQRIEYNPSFLEGLIAEALVRHDLELPPLHISNDSHFVGGKPESEIELNESMDLNNSRLIYNKCFVSSERFRLLHSPISEDQSLINPYVLLGIFNNDKYLGRETLKLINEHNLDNSNKKGCEFSIDVWNKEKYEININSKHFIKTAFNQYFREKNRAMRISDIKTNSNVIYFPENIMLFSNGNCEEGILLDDLDKRIKEEIQPSIAGEKKDTLKVADYVNMMIDYFVKL